MLGSPRSLKLILLFSIRVFFCCTASLFFPSFCLGAVDKQILIIHSYHQNFAWTQNISEGINTIFKKSDFPANFCIEYMDTKRHVPQDLSPHLKELFLQKYENNQPDLVLVSDNNAFNFIKPDRTVTGCNQMPATSIPFLACLILILKG